MRTEPLMDFPYMQGGDGMMYPDIRISKNPESDRVPAGRFGSRWKDYMAEACPHRLSELVAQGRINEVIQGVDEEAGQQKEMLIQAMLRQQPVPDTEDTMERAGHMNMIAREAEETVMNELVLKVR